MDKFHGIIIQESLRDPSVLRNVTILGTKQGKDWKLLVVSVPDSRMDSVLELVKSNLRTDEGISYYTHFYSNDRLILVFPDRVFHIKPNKETWKPVVDYGLSMGIPKEQPEFSQIVLRMNLSRRTLRSHFRYLLVSVLRYAVIMKGILLISL